MSLDGAGARLRSAGTWTSIHFSPRDGERLIGTNIIDTQVGDETVSDVALRPTTNARDNWMGSLQSSAHKAAEQLGRRATVIG